MKQEEILKLSYPDFLDFLAGQALMALGKGTSMRDIMAITYNWVYWWQEANVKK